MADALIERLRAIVGRRHLLTGDGPTRRYRQGYRYGDGPVVAVVRPGSLIEQWRVAEACVAADVSLIVQAANTGLTGGSTPDGDDYPGGVVIVSTTRLDGFHLLDGGRQVLCLPGATLFGLERRLQPLGREPHSVIGSSCIGASVVGGVCNNSGGSLVRRGPAYTELALFGRVTPAGVLELVNHLGILLDGDPEAMLAQVEAGTFGAVEPAGRASDAGYAEHVRAIDADTPARFNADPRCLHEASGSAGKLIVFAVRLDTFPAERDTATFYIGTDDPAELTALRRHLLQHAPLPIAAEYIHREAFDIAATYGKDTFLAIQHLGTDRLPLLFAWKARVDSWATRLGERGSGLSDRLMQAMARMFPRHLPARMREWRDRYEHHLLLKMAGDGIAAARAHLESAFPSASGAVFECTPAEDKAAFLHRFAVAGAAVRYRAIHRDRVADIVALDVALPRNACDWVEVLPPAFGDALAHRLYYGHFFCHVFHQDYIVRAGHDPHEVEAAMLRLLDARGARYPAEHNVGHLYDAAPTLAAHYRALDPRNQLNPGIGRLTRKRGWAEGEPDVAVRLAAP